MQKRMVMFSVLLFICVVALTGCGKEKYNSRKMGTWFIRLYI